MISIFVVVVVWMIAAAQPITTTLCAIHEIHYGLYIERKRVYSFVCFLSGFIHIQACTVFCHSQPTVKYGMPATTIRHKKLLFLVKLDCFNHVIKEMGVFNMRFHLESVYDDRCVGVSVLLNFFFIVCLLCVRCCFCLYCTQNQP